MKDINVDVVKGFKGFGPNLTCKNFKFEEGKTYIHDGEVKICNSGFHFCQNPLDIFSYYPPTSEFAEVEGAGDVQTHKEDSKVACKELHIKAKISLHNLIDFGIKFILNKVDWENTNRADERKSAATNTGYNSAATNTGNYSAATNTGNYSAATTEGKNSIAIVTGYKSKARGVKDCWLVLVERDGNYKILTVKAILPVDGVKIKENTFYTLVNGECIEC